MRIFSLTVLMCFSVGLQGGIPNPANAQKYTHSGQGIVASAQVTLESDYGQLQSLVSSMEVALCGTSSGLIIDGTGADSKYTNCTGGAMNDYNLWAAQANYWEPIITKDTNAGSWTAGYDACDATGYGDNNHNTNFYTDLQSSMASYVSSMQSGMSAIVGSSDGSQPNNLLAAGNLVTKMNDELNQLGSAINSAGLLDQAKTINTAWSDYNTGKTTFTTCWNNAVAAHDTCATHPCATELGAMLTSFESEVGAIIALFEALLPLLPYEYGTYSMQPANSATMIKCLLPSKLKCDPTTGACSYLIPNFSFDINTALSQITSFVTQANNMVKSYSDQVNAIVVSINAIVNQLKGLSASIQGTQDQVNNTINNCKTDITNYQEELAKIDEIIDIVVGAILGVVVIELTGGLGIVGLAQLVMVLTMIPQINAVTIGAVSNIIALDLSKEIMASYG